MGRCKIGKCDFSRYEIIDKYCLLHEPNKDNWGFKEKEKLNKEIKNYINKQKILGNSKIKFINAYFLGIEWSEVLKDLINYEVIFEKCVFLENARFEDIKCKKLTFNDCRFLDGGSIKNKKGKLYIKELDLKIYELVGDFVVDLGRFTKTSLHDDYGIIEYIRFSNHQKGSGRIFFIGLNDKLKKGDFSNRILDNVIFQNCTLENCYFLNSKIESTKFLNVVFPHFKDHIFNIDIVISMICLITIFLFVYFMKSIKDLEYDNLIITSSIYFLYFFVIVFLIILALYPLSVFYNFLLKTIGLVDHKTNRHIGIADEESVIKELKEKGFRKAQENLTSLKYMYDQLVINFEKQDKQLSGSFIYSAKFYQSLVFIRFKDIFNAIISKGHYFINGYGQRWFRALWHMVFIFVVFSLIFAYLYKHQIHTNKVYYFHIKNNAPKFLNKLNSKNNNEIEYLKIGVYKSFSNAAYLFRSKTQNWFIIDSQLVFLLDLMEKILISLFFIAFVKAIWNNMKY